MFKACYSQVPVYVSGQVHHYFYTLVFCSNQTQLYAFPEYSLISYLHAFKRASYFFLLEFSPSPWLISTIFQNPTETGPLPNVFIIPLSSCDFFAAAYTLLPWLLWVFIEHLSIDTDFVLGFESSVTTKIHSFPLRDYYPSTQDRYIN